MGKNYHDLLQSSTIYRHLSSAGLVAGTMSQVKIEVQHDASFPSMKQQYNWDRDTIHTIIHTLYQYYNSYQSPVMITISLSIHTAVCHAAQKALGARKQK